MSNLTLIIGNKNYSSWSLRPWVFMKHNQIEFNEKRVPLFTTTTDKELALYNSDFKVPILQDGELLVWDSLSILEYLSEQYLESKGWPHEPSARAFARSVSCEMHSSFINVRSELPMNCRKKFENVVLSSNAKREIERITSLWRQCRDKYGMGGDWLFGQYSIADAMFAPMVFRFNGYGIPLGDVEQAYVQSTLQQPAIVKWIASSNLEKEVIQESEARQ